MLKSFANVLFFLPRRSTHRLGGRIYEGRSEFLYWVSGCVYSNYTLLRSCSASGELQVISGLNMAELVVLLLIRKEWIVRIVHKGVSKVRYMHSYCLLRLAFKYKVYRTGVHAPFSLPLMSHVGSSQIRATVIADKAESLLRMLYACTARAVYVKYLKICWYTIDQWFLKK